MRRCRKKYRFNRYMRRKWYLRVTSALFIVLCLISCASSQVILDVPARPVLEKVNEDVPLVAQRNLLAMITYAQRLELVVYQYERMIK